jgi:hypothetical protein
MKQETLSNAIQGGISLVLAIVSLILAVGYSAWWNLFTAAACLVISWIFYVDDAYGIESVRTYLKRKMRK